MEISVVGLTIKETLDLIKSRQVSVYELISSLFGRIERIDKKVNSFITLNKEEALRDAKKVDESLNSGDKSLALLGIPMAIKDSFVTDGIRTTAGSKVLKNYLGQYDATVVERLKKAGAIIVGKTNLDEFSLGFTTETSAFKTTSNPWDLSKVPGGSSGGSAAAVAADECVFAIGSEHYDSTRQPAAWCGVVGVKPTYGLVSRYGIVAMASSLECPGPITKSVYDTAFVLSIIAGFDPKDANSADKKIPRYHQLLNSNIKGFKIGIAEEYFSENIEEGVRKRVLETIDTLESLGVKKIRVSLPPFHYSSSVFEVLYRAEVASNLARYDGLRYGEKGEFTHSIDSYYERVRKKFGPLIKNQILTDLRAIAGGDFEKIYEEALKIRQLLINDFKKIFKKVDLVVSPMSPCLPFKKGFYRDGRYHPTKETDRFGKIVDLIAQLPALCGFPGISVPCGFSQDLPVGLQVYGPPFSEQKIFDLSFAYEKEASWKDLKPKL